jgi:hypothetical protein
MGGVFNVVNLHLYHYAGNNPVKYVDPNGREDEDWTNTLVFEASELVIEASIPDPEPQISNNPATPHCDINAWNNAVENNLDPRAQNGIYWDGNEVDAADVFALFPDNRNELPPANSSGFAFYPGTNPEHIILYQRGESDTYTAHQSDGIDPTTPRDWNIQGSFARDAIFVPLPQLRMRE